MFKPKYGLGKKYGQRRQHHDVNNTQSYSYRALGGFSTSVVGLVARDELAARAVNRESQVVDGLGADDEVERGREGGAFVKVTHPQLGARELPFHVSVILQQTRATSQLQWLAKRKTALRTTK